MKINEIHIQNFGCLKDKSLVLADGINVIYGPNESGKTTLHTFVKSMFFGIRRLRGRAAKNDSYTRYEPWENPSHYAGSLFFTCGEKRFRLERNFSKEHGRVELVCVTDGERLNIEDGDLKMLLGGISESIYDNTVSIGQLGGAAGAELARELKNYMANYQDSGDGGLDLDRAFLRLKQQKKELEGELARLEREHKERLAKLQEQIEFQEEEVEDLIRQKEGKVQDIAAKQTEMVQEEPVKKPSLLWNVAMLLMAFAAGAGAAFLEGWFRFGALGLGVLGEVVLAFFRGRQRRYWGRQRRREHQQKDLTARELDRMEFLREHLEGELQEKNTYLQNLRSEYEEAAGEVPQYEGIPENIQALDLSMAVMDRISRQMQGRVGGHLKKRTSEILRELTDGKYRQVDMDESLKMGVDTGQRYIPLEQLSRGAIEQVYFALRMAASEVLCQEEELPVLLDDVFAMYDETRLKQALWWLHRSGKQVVLCTCHTRELEVLKQSNIPCHVLRLG
ncbi:MAG: ATP-binding protein [Blautia sp.]|jgi:uncharacterized protein YhaN